MKVFGLVASLLVGIAFLTPACGDRQLSKSVRALDGTDGKDGKDGATGAQGPQGPAGADGKEGTSLGLTVEKATAAQCLASGYVYTTWYDLNTNGIYDSGEPGVNTKTVCNGSKGDKGDTGEKGDKGDKGEPCTMNPHAEGIAIMCGKDVYIVKDGQSCSTKRIDDYTNKVTCPNGSFVVKNGANGKDGKNGTNGTNGKDGTNGTNGTNGTSGKDGKNGSNGTNGHDGASGPSCKVTKEPNNDILVRCGNTVETIPTIRNITICLFGTYDCPYAAGWHTYTMPVDHFVADILGRRNYQYGKCGN